MKSIKNKILLVVISGLLIITSVVSGIAVSVTYNIMNKDAEKILSNVSEKEASLINDVLGDVEKSADILDHYTTNEISDISEIFDSKAREKFMEKTKKMFVEIAFNTSGVDVFARADQEMYLNKQKIKSALTE